MDHHASERNIHDNGAHQQAPHSPHGTKKSIITLTHKMEGINQNLKNSESVSPMNNNYNNIQGAGAHL